MGSLNTDSPLTNKEITFKIHWINETLRFIKNEKVPVLNYPEMSLNKIYSVRAMILERNNNVDLDSKNLYVPLWEAMQIYGLKYNFKLSVKKCENNKGVMKLEKILKTSASSQNNSQPKETNTSTSNKIKKEETEKKYIKTVKEILDSISPTFIKKSLTTIFGFVTDDSQASLNFDNLARIETMFFQNFLGILKRYEVLDEFFSPMCNELLRKIDLTLKSKEFVMEMSAITVDTDTCRRQLMFRKIPHLSKKKTKTSNTTNNNNNNETPDTIKATKNEISSNNCSVKMLNKNVIKFVTNKQTDEPNGMEKNVGPIDNIQNGVTINNHVDKSMDILDCYNSEANNETDKTNSIDNSAAAKENRTEPTIDKDVEKIVEVLDSPKSEQQTPNYDIDKTYTAINKIDTKGLPKVKVKLIEGLTTPVKSDIAIRMMKSMGWEGGALGAREGGIMEPIMPAIHLEKNAGLGHVKEKTKASFKMDILELILALLDKDTSISIMDIKSPLSKKETAYLHRINKNFNDRKKPDLAKKEEIILAKKILKFMINNPRLKFFITSNEKRIKFEKLEEPALIWKNESEIKAEPVVKQTIQKTINQPTINQSNLNSAIQSNQSTNQTENEKQSTIEIAKRKLEKAIKQPTNQSVKNQSEDLLTSDEILSLIKRKMTANSLKHLKTRMYLLKVCLDFFKSNHTDVTINRTFRGKSKGFVEKMCGFINTRRGQFATDIEEMFWKEILRHLGETYVMNHHRDKNTCTLTKVRKDQVLTQVQNCHEIDNFIEEDSSDEELIRKAEEYNIKNINFLENGVSYFDINSYDSRVTAKLHKPEISREIFDSQQEIKNKKTANFNIAIMKNSCSININHVRISNGTQPMTAETAGKIQNKILDSIRNSNFSFLPNLKCHGVKKNFLIYTCYDSRTLEYLKCILRDYSVLEFEDCERYKMVLHIKSFSKFDVFSWLQHYYSELKIEKWTLVLTAQYEDRLLLTVTLDKESFLFICNNNFRLFIGIDEVVFDVSF